MNLRKGKKMKTNYLLRFTFVQLLSLFFITSTFAQTASSNPPNTIISGAIVGDLMKVISVTVDRSYIDNSKKRINSPIENDSFKLEFYLDVPQKVTISYLRNTADIYIEPGDHLHIDGDANSFYFSFQFKDSSAVNNEFLREFNQKHQLYYTSFQYFKYKKGLVWYRVHRNMDAEMRGKSPEEYKAFMDGQRDEMMAMLDNYKKNDQLTEDFKLFMWTEINYYWSYHMLTYGYAFGFFHNIDFQDFFGFMYEVPLQNEKGMGSKFYRDFVMGAVNYYCEGPLKIPSPDDKIEEQLAKQFKYGDKELKGKVKAYFLTEIIRQAYAKEVINDLMNLHDEFLQTNTHKEFNKKIGR